MVKSLPKYFLLGIRLYKLKKGNWEQLGPFGPPAQYTTSFYDEWCLSSIVLSYYVPFKTFYPKFCVFSRIWQNYFFAYLGRSRGWPILTAQIQNFDKKFSINIKPDNHFFKHWKPEVNIIYRSFAILKWICAYTLFYVVLELDVRMY